MEKMALDEPDAKSAWGESAVKTEVHQPKFQKIRSMAVAKQKTKPAPGISWYYSINGKQNGPITDDGVRQLHRDGVITRDVLLWQQGLENWVKYDEFERITSENKTTDILDYARKHGYNIPNRSESRLGADQMLAGGGDQGGMQSCPVCHRNLPLEEFVEIEGEAVCFRCRDTMELKSAEAGKVSEAKKVSDAQKKKTVKLEKSVIQKMARKYQPQAAQKKSEEEPVNMVDVALAGVLNRVPAKLIDWVVPGLLASGVFLALRYAHFGEAAIGLALVAFLVLNIIHVALTSYFLDETLGKQLTGLRTVTEDGEKVPMPRMAYRAALEQISLLAVGMGYILALGNDDRKTWHDKMAKTLIIKLDR